MKPPEAALLEQRGIKPSAQRVAIAAYVLHTDVHPSAEEVWIEVQKAFPMVSRATVYNTLNLFVEKGLLQELVLTEGCLVFDPNTSRHHHLIDERTGRIHDVPWHHVHVSRVDEIEGFDINDYQVLLRGTKE